MSDSAVTKWFIEQIPDEWFDDLVATGDKDEIVVCGALPADAAVSAADDPETQALAELEAAAQFREATRDTRIEIALRAEALFERKVSWVVQCGSTTKPFAILTLPVMTRLGFEERKVLDTLVAGGVARSRSEALNWCVRRVGDDHGEWLDDLRAAVSGIDDIRAKGPASCWLA